MVTSPLDAGFLARQFTGMTVIALCVPFASKDDARNTGARWDREQRVWTCERRVLTTDAYARLRPFVPHMYRPELAPPYIRPWMVPQTAWGKNLRAVLGQDEWDVVRKAAYTRAGHRCRICGGRGPQWPVEADEGWEYDEERRVQTLKGVIALCPDCHKIRHWGKTSVDGHEPAARERLMWINGWTADEVDIVVGQAMDEWHRRSHIPWESDYGWVTREHGFAISEEGMARADAANGELVFEARLRSGYFEVLPPDPPAPLNGQLPARRHRSLWFFLKRLAGY